MSRKAAPRLGIIAGALVIGVVFALWMAPAFACTRQGHIETHPVQAVPGSTVRVEGSQFGAATEPVNVFWGGAKPETGTLLASVQPAADGTFAVDVAIPANALVGQTYLLAATQVDNPPFSASTTVFVGQSVAMPAAPALVDRPGSPAANPAPAAVPAVGSPQLPADQPAAEAPVPAVANASPYGIATLRAGEGAPARPLDQAAPSKSFGGVRTLGRGASPWILMPIAVVGLTLLTGSAAYAARQPRREKALAPTR